MKNKATNQRGVVLAVLALMVGTFHFLLADPDCGNFGWGCTWVSVGAGENEVRQRGCPTDPEDPEEKVVGTICGKCEEITIPASAGGATLWFDHFEDGTCYIDGSGHEGSVTVDKGGTDCQVEVTHTNCFQWLVRIYEPKRSGSVRITAKVTSDCAECDQPGTGDPCVDCEIVTKDYEVTGIVEVDVPPDGGGDDSGPGGGCSNCKDGSGNGSRQAGTAYVGNDSVNFRLNLGLSTPGRDAGYLSLFSETPSVDLAKPVALVVPFNRPGVTILPWTDQTIKQVKTPQGLVHVSVKDNYEYHLQCFYESSIAKDGNGDYIMANGFYTTNSAAYTTWIVKNPDGASSSNRLWITELRDSASRDFKYTYGSDYRWDLLQPDGQTTISTWKIRDSSDGTGATTNYFRQTTHSSAVVRKNQKTLKHITALSDTVLLQEVEGDAGVTRTTTYTYYPGNAAAGSQNKLQRVDHPDGNWIYYKYDQLGRCTSEFSAYGNYAPPASGVEPVPLTDNCKVTEYAYTLTSANDGIDDDGVLWPSLARRTIVKIPASSGLREVSRSYLRVTDPYTRETRRCPNPGASWSDAGNLITITAKDAQGRLSSTTSPDGTITTYYYPDDYMTVVQRISTSGAGSQTTTSVDEFGLLLSSETIDWQTGITLAEETYDYEDGSSNYLDPLRRSYDVTDLAGRKTQYRYNGCCGLDYIIDPDGVKTYQVQDSLLKWDLGTKKVVEVVGATERTIQITNKLDAVGNVLAAKRVGTNGSIMTLEQFEYDALGRTIRHTNALDGVTTNLYVIASSRLQEIMLNPDGGTRTNAYYRDGNLETITGTAVQGTKYVHGVEQDGGIWREYTKEVKLDSNYAETSEWTKTYLDGAGRSYKTVFAASTGAPYQQSFYNDYGRVWKSRDPDGVVTLFAYGGMGEVEYTATDLDQDDVIDTDGPDRVTKIERSYLEATGGKPDLMQMDTIVWTTENNQTVQKTISRTEVSTDGLKAWRTVYKDAADVNTAVTTLAETQIPTSGNGWTKTMTRTAADGSSTVAEYKSDNLVSVTTYSSAPAQVGKTTYGYDAHGRQNVVSDARNGSTTNWFNNADDISSTKTPAPSIGQSAQVTTNLFDSMGRIWKTTLPDNTSVTNEYFPTGLLKKTYGSRTYPVEYTYDYAGRMKTMKTWQNFVGNSGTATTTWNYDIYRGWLSSKDYADATTGAAGTVGPDYTYTPGGRPKTRTWARIGTSSQRIVTTYTYGFDGSGGDEHGDVTGVSYSNDPAGTPGVTYTYDRLGRQATIIRNGITTTLSRNDAGQQIVEYYSGGILGGLSVTNGYDQFLRRTNLSLLNSSSSILAATAYGYDTAGRLSTVSDGTHSATYGYLANSPLAGTVTFKQNTTTRITTTKQYDYLNRLALVQSAVNSLATPQISHGYTYNSANQRTRDTWSNGSYWDYTYDAIGQVTSGKHRWVNGTLVAGQQFEYTYDDIGNRTQTRVGGSDTGTGLRTASYTTNALNQYSQRTVPGAVDVLGAATVNATVTVEGQTAYRRGGYFWKETALNNASSAVWEEINVSSTQGVNQYNQQGNTYLPKTPELFYYDLDGNLTNDGRWTYTWDAENRLVNMISASGAPTGSKLKLDFAYDWQGRRIEKIVSTNNGSIYVAQYTNRFVYDGWNLIATLNPQLSAINSFMWGLDLSGNLHGAGGVGGLLAVNDTANGVHFCAYDGNGNVAGLVKATDGTVTANFDYGPFGELIRITGAMSKVNPFRFSTKYQDNETELLYYGYRYYNASTGRWLSPDPIEEGGGLNLSGFVQNNPIGLIDRLGLDILGPEDPCIEKNRTIITSFHGSVEIEGNTYNYINTDNPGMENASVKKPAAEIDRRVTGAVHARIRASTQPSKLSRPKPMQMSTSLGGYVQIGICCPSGRVKMRWSIAANLYAATPATVGGAHAAEASIGGHRVVATPQSPSQIRGGQEILNSGDKVPFTLGQGWIDNSTTGYGVFSGVQVSAVFTCVPK